MIESRRFKGLFYILFGIALLFLYFLLLEVFNILILLASFLFIAVGCEIYYSLRPTFMETRSIRDYLFSKESDSVLVLNGKSSTKHRYDNENYSDFV